MENVRKSALKTLSVVLCVFVLVSVNINLFGEQPSMALFGMLGLMLVLLHKPACKWCPENTLLRIIDLFLIVLTIFCFGYVFVQSEPMLKTFWIDGTVLGDRAGSETATDFAVSLVGLLLVLEATRRVVGWTLPLLCVAFIAYAYFGQSMPDWLFPHRGFTWQQIVQKSFLQMGGVFGIAMRVMFYYVFLFVLFGTLLEQTGATAYVINTARRIFQRVPGGPALVSVISSAMMGSLSGSAVANTATTGTVTIPLMKSAGFKPETAAGVEAAASSGGALMPPIMGAGAFMMLEMVEPAVTYPEIIKAAIIPALLYYTALLMMVYFYSRRIGAAAEAEALANKNDASVATKAVLVEGGTAGKSELWRGVVFFGSFIVLISMLVPPVSFTPFRSVSIALVAILLLSIFSRGTWLGAVSKLDFSPKGDGEAGNNKDEVAAAKSGLPVVDASPGKTDSAASSASRSDEAQQGMLSEFVSRYLRGMFSAMVNASNSGMALIVAASCVGITLAIVDMTGIGVTLPAKVLEISSDSPIMALVLLMVSTIILGMGLPSAVCYLLMAILVGSVLSKLETAPLAAHLFIFYFGMMSMVTPPVALAAYTGAAIAKADVMKSAISAFRFGLVGFALPFAFVLSPELIMLTPDNTPASLGIVAATLSLTLVAIIGLAAGIAGFVFTSIGFATRIVFVGASLVVFLCRLQGIELGVQLGATLLIAGLVFMNYTKSRAGANVQTLNSTGAA